MPIPDEFDVQMREAVIQIDPSEFMDLGLEEFGLLCSEAGIRGVTLLVCTGPGGIMTVQVQQPFDEARLSDLDCVEWWERIKRETDVVYLLEVEIPDVPNTATPYHELGVSNHGITLTDHGMKISFVGPQESITQIVDESTDAGVPMELLALSDYRGSRDALDSLTNRQHEIVRTAHAMGYYEVPRAASTAEIARDLDIDRSTVSEHLQRAERNLLTAILGANE